MGWWLCMRPAIEGGWCDSPCPEPDNWNRLCWCWCDCMAAWWWSIPGWVRNGEPWPPRLAPKLPPKLPVLMRCACNCCRWAAGRGGRPIAGLKAPIRVKTNRNKTLNIMKIESRDEKENEDEIVWKLTSWKMAVRAGCGWGSRSVHNWHERIGRESDHRAQIERIRVGWTGQRTLAALSNGRSRTGQSRTEVESCTIINFMMLKTIR